MDHKMTRKKIPLSVAGMSGLLFLLYALTAMAIGCDNDKPKKKDKAPAAAGAAAATATSSSTGTGTNGDKSKDGADNKDGDGSKVNEGPKDKSGDDKSGDDKSGGSDPKNLDDTSDSDDRFYRSSDFPNSSKKLSEKLVTVFLTNHLADGLQFTQRAKSDDDSSPCIEKLRNTKFTGDSKSIEFTYKNKGCSTQGSTISLEYRFKMTCNKAAFVSFIGQKLDDTNENDLIKRCPNGQATSISNYLITTTTKPSNSNTKKTTATKGAFSTATGKPCEITTTSTTTSIENGCKLYISEVTSTEGKPDTKQTATLIGSFKDSKVPFTSENPSAGSLTFTLNNWSGSLKFKSNDEPNIIAKDGDGGEIDEALSK